MWHDATRHARVSVPLSCDTRARRESEQKKKKEKKERRGRREERGDENDPCGSRENASHRDESDTLDGFTRDAFFYENYLSISPSPPRDRKFSSSRKIRILSRTINNPLECFQFCWETEKKFVSQSVAPIREDLSTSCYYRRGFLPFLLPATSVTPRARPQELVSSERELARHARGIRVATLA